MQGRDEMDVLTRVGKARNMAATLKVQTISADNTESRVTVTSLLMHLYALDC